MPLILLNIALYVSLLPPYVPHDQLILLTRIIFAEEYRSKFPHYVVFSPPPVTSSLLGPIFFLNTPFSNTLTGKISYNLTARCTLYVHTYIRTYIYTHTYTHTYTLRSKGSWTEFFYPFTTTPSTGPRLNYVVETVSHKSANWR